VKIGRYEVRGELGRGGVGVVYVAWDPRRQREVALKVVQPGQASERFNERFRRETNALLLLKHPHVIPVLDAGTAGETSYLVMPLNRGRSLQARLDDEGPLDPREAALLACKLASAAGAAHELGILHRDLKPDNVLLTSEGEPLLIDFGLTKAVGAPPLPAAGAPVSPESFVRQLSLEGQFLGTPGYWAPEQGLGRHDTVGPHADIYGLGGILYAMLTGEAPNPGGSLGDSIGFLMSDAEVAPPSELRRGIQSSLEAICMRCLRKEPAHRFASADELARALEAYLAGAPLPRSPSSAAHRLAPAPRGGLVDAGTAWAPVPRELKVAGGIALAGVLLVLLGLRPLYEWILPARAAQGYARAAHEHLDRREFDAALESFDAALELDPSRVETCLQRGLLRAELGDYEGAIVDYDAVIDARPRDANALRARGACEEMLGAMKRAARDYERALQLDPRLPGAEGMRALVVEQLGRPPREGP
jgi:tetratricopeptide (TPR) repeat protein/predicted Ser/Thr protein kinase